MDKVVTETNEVSKDCTINKKHHLRDMMTCGVDHSQTIQQKTESSQHPDSYEAVLSQTGTYVCSLGRGDGGYVIKRR